MYDIFIPIKKSFKKSILVLVATPKNFVRELC